MTIRLERLPLRRTAVKADIARFFPSLILAGYGIFILSLYVRGDLTLYINPTYIWPTTLAGVLLLVLAVGRLVFQRGGNSGDACCAVDSCSCAADSCDCDSSSARIWPYALLSIPLFLAVLFPPRGLAAFSAGQRGVQIGGMTSVHTSATVHRISLSVDTSSFSLQDWVGALSADPNPRDYLGKPIKLTGIVIHNPASVPPGFIMVIRYQVTCCIADARPVGLIVRDTSHGTLQDNQWITVTGTMGETKYQGDNVAVVEPKNIAPTKSGNPYLY